MDAMPPLLKGDGCAPHPRPSAVDRGAKSAYLWLPFLTIFCSRFHVYGLVPDQR